MGIQRIAVACALGMSLTTCGANAVSGWSEVGWCGYEIRDRAAVLSAARDRRDSAGADRDGDRLEVGSAVEGSCPVPKGVSTSPLGARIRPVLLVPSGADTDVDGLVARISESLDRVQTWFREQSVDHGLGARSVDIDRITILRADLQGIAGAELVARALGRVSDNDGDRVANDVATALFVVGAEPVLAEVARTGQRQSVVVAGDLLIASLPAACTEEPCNDRLRLGDGLMRELVGQLTGSFDRERAVGAAVLAAAAAGVVGVDSGPFGIALADDELSSAEALRLATSPLHGSGRLAGGRVAVADDVELVTDLAVGARSALVVWQQRTGEGTEPLADGTPVAQDSAIGQQHTRLMTRLIHIGASDGQSDLAPAHALSRPPAPTSMVRRVDGDAAAAYDSRRDEFQLIWVRRIGTDQGIESLLMARRVSAVTGRSLSDEQVLWRGSGDGPVDVDLAYAASSDRFNVIWGPSSSRTTGAGGIVRAAMLTGSGDRLGDPVVVDESGKGPQVAFASDRQRFLTAWTSCGGRDGDIRGQLFADSGALLDQSGAWVVSPAPFDLGAAGDAGLPSIAYQASTESWRVGFLSADWSGRWEIGIAVVDARRAQQAPAPPVRITDDGYLYDPSVAVSSATGDMVVASTVDQGTFFDGVGALRIDIVGRDGQVRSLSVRGHKGVLARTVAASHPVDDLVMVASSGSDGVYVDLVATGQPSEIVVSEPVVGLLSR